MTTPSLEERLAAIEKQLAALEHDSHAPQPIAPVVRAVVRDMVEAFALKGDK